MLRTTLLTLGLAVGVCSQTRAPTLIIRTRPPALRNVSSYVNSTTLNVTRGNVTRGTLPPPRFTTMPPTTASMPMQSCPANVGVMFVRVSRTCLQCEALATMHAESATSDDFVYNTSQARPCPTECLQGDDNLYPTLSSCLGLTTQSQSLAASRVLSSSTASNVSAEFNLTGTNVVPMGINFYRQRTDTATIHLRNSDDSGGRQRRIEETAVIGSATPPSTRQRRQTVPGGRLAVMYQLSTRNYNGNGTIDTVDGASGSSGSHIYLSYASGTTATPIAPYPSSYQFLGPQIVSAGVLYPNGTTVSGSASILTFSLSVDAPDGFWVRPDTGEVMVSARNVVGNVSFSLKASYPGVPDVILRTFVFTIGHRDIDLPANGPNGRACANDGMSVDYTEFDNQYTCACLTSGDFVGANCDQLMSLHAQGVTNGNGHWLHNRTAWAAEKSYIVAAPEIQRIAIMPINLTVSNRFEEVWWEIRCSRFTNLTSGVTTLTSTTPDGVYIDTVVGTLSVAFALAQVNTSYSGCQLRIFYTQRNYLPFQVVSNMTFTVRDPDFGKPRLRVVSYTYGTLRSQSGIPTFHNRTNWTIGENYAIPPVTTVLTAVSDDNARLRLTQEELGEVQYVLKRVGEPNGFFIESNTGEIVGSPNLVAQESVGTAVLLATHPDYLDGVVARIRINALFADTDSRSGAVGPNNRDCNESRQRVDGVEFDGHFTCNCTGFIFQGENCDEPRAQVQSHGSGSDNSVSSTVIGVAVAVVLAVAIFAAVQMYQKRRAYWELMKPVDFQPHLDRLAGAGIVGRINKDDPPKELERKNIVLEVELGSGNFGEVWKGTWLEEVKRTGRKSSTFKSLSSMTSQRVAVAVKTLKNVTQAGNDEFLREASVTWQFNHENVVRMYGVVTCGAPYLLVLELCAHGELKGYLEKGDPDDDVHYSLGRLFHFLVGIAEGMKHLIQCGFVHRDLAARNVLVGDNYDAKICDFGLGRETAEDSDYYTSNDANMLVPIRWTDPNVLGTGKFSEYTDVWAFGVTAIEIFTRGATPYRGWLNTFIIEQTKAGYRMPCPEGCPPEVYKSVIYPCWLSADENASPRRPNFSILCAELARVGAKIDPRARTQSSLPKSGVKMQKKNRAYAPASSATEKTPNNYYEYSSHAVEPQEPPGVYEIPVPGKPEVQGQMYEYMEADVSRKGTAASTASFKNTTSPKEQKSDTSKQEYVPRSHVTPPAALYSPMSRRGTLETITLNPTQTDVTISSKQVEEDMESRGGTLEKEDSFGFNKALRTPSDGYLETVGE